MLINSECAGLLQEFPEADTYGRMVMLPPSQPPVTEVFRASQQGIVHPFICKQQNNTLATVRGCHGVWPGSVVVTGTYPVTQAWAESEAQKR